MIFIKAEARTTDAADTIIEEAIALADRMNVPVEIMCKGVKVFAKPMDDPAVLIGEWHRVSVSNYDYEDKIAATLT